MLSFLWGCYSLGLLDTLKRDFLLKSSRVEELETHWQGAIGEAKTRAESSGLEVEQLSQQLDSARSEAAERREQLAREKEQLIQQLDSVRSEAAERLEQLAREKEELSQQLEFVRSEAEKRQNGNEDLERKNEELFLEVRDKNERLSQLSGELERTAQLLSDSEAAFDAVNRELTELGSAATIKESTIELLQNRLIEKDSELKQLGTKLSHLQLLCEDHSNQLTVGHAKMQKLEAELTAKTCHLTDLERELIELKGLQQAADSKKLPLVGQLESLSEAQADLQPQLSLVWQEKDQLERNGAEQSKNNALVETKMTESSRALTDLEGQLEASYQRVAGLEQEKAVLEVKLADYSEALVDIKAMNESVLMKARDSDKELVRVKAFAEDLLRKNCVLTDGMVELRQELAATTGRLAQVEAELSAETASTKDDDEQLQHLIQVVNEKTRELNQARSENSHLVEQLGEERERREQLELARADIRYWYRT